MALTKAKAERGFENLERVRATPHVDVSVIERRGPHQYVRATCPMCQETRWVSIANVLGFLRQGTWTGLCMKDKHVGHPAGRVADRPDHPSVDWSDWVVEERKKQRWTLVGVSCPDCQTKKYQVPSGVAARIRKGTFLGLCKPCRGQRLYKHKVGRRSGPRRIGWSIENGYVQLYRPLIAETDRWLFEAMARKDGSIAEHRLAMARHLGRPLGLHELVDHMDGNKVNNEVSNLRIYRRGKNDPGSHNGWGTYYHELQVALGEIRRLKGEQSGDEQKEAFDG